MSGPLSLRESPHYGRVLAIFVVSSLIAIFTTTAILSTSLANFMTRQMLMREAQVSMDFLNAIVQVENSTGYFLKDPPDDNEQPGSKELIAHVSHMPDIFRANVYAHDGRVLWSTDKELVGRVFTDNAELDAAMQGELHPEIGTIEDHLKEEHHVAMPEGVAEYIEYYIPIWSADQSAVVGAIEVYKAPASLLASIHRVINLARLGAIVAGGVLFFGLFMVVLYSARILRRQEARLVETERLAVVGEMASAVAHGLRNPLAAVRSCAELMAEDDLPDHSRESVHDIIDQVDRLETWIRSFLLRTRSDPAGAGDSAHISLIIEKCLRNFESQFRRRGISVVVERNESSSVAQGGAAEIEQVLSTILSNAVEAMVEGGTIHVGWAPAPGGRIAVTVADSGPGLSEAQLDQIFTPFQTSKASGLGVGLALGRRIAERLGGSLDLRNGRERGVEAVLTLPARA
ncbi:sensor histidine kinase [Palleronia caenipelagi]|uniref:histidine kinase n=1 Tax=Palleronia caenipelagi TaxID=2489174 RepID=A0A547PPD1_9RHOB|nr:HAMP domain-containing sensor histidine kinase [Palleronia caenipelagi]TRD16001.1 HAMP domain-containing histidine kinase [Palleronia caenipelagi]